MRTPAARLLAVLTAAGMLLASASGCSGQQAEHLAGQQAGQQAEQQAGQQTEQQADPQAEEARQTVASLFSALEERDCAAVAAVLDEPLRRRAQQTTCEKFLANEPLARAEGLHIGEARRDGRDRNAFMVTVSLEVEHAARPFLVRVAPKNGDYRIVSM